MSTGHAPCYAGGMTTCIASLSLVIGLAAVTAKPPATPRRPVTDSYHGVTVTDDYRWLERADDPEVTAWSEAQNAAARAYLDALPGRPLLRQRIAAIYNFEAPGYGDVRQAQGAKLFFASKRQPPAQQPVLVTLTSLDDPKTERVIYDPNEADPTAGTYYDWYTPSHDGRLVALSISRNGSEDGTLAIIDVATGKALPDRIPRVQYGTAGGSVAWKGDGSGLWYTRYPRPGERQGKDQFFYQQIWWHQLGTPVEQDRYAFGKDQPRIGEHALVASPDGRWVLDQVSNGDGGEVAFFLAPAQPGAPWRQVAGFADKIRDARFGADGALYLHSRREAPRGKIVRVAPADPALARAATVLPEQEGVLEDYQVTATRLWTSSLVGGPSRLCWIPLGGGKPVVVPTTPLSTVQALERIGDGDEILFASGGYLEPPAHFTVGAGQPHRTALVKRSAVTFSDLEVAQVFARSKDGTRVPLTIVKRKGTRLDGRNPTLLTGYGGYGSSSRPAFLERRRVWFDHGGVLAMAAIRGGGEYGEAWHEGGMLTRKQNVFDDFAACAEWLIDNHTTGPTRLAIQGGSNGGLLMGAMITQHRQLFRAVVSHVGIYDMLRFELQANGEFNTTELGSVKDRAQFQALHAYSPYHHVAGGTAYPSVLFATGAHDPRVDPLQSRKMTARLQASGSTRPILLRTSAETGHGIGTSRSQVIEQEVDVYAFLFHELGVALTR
jgi:prolyl oligopeptidase